MNNKIKKITYSAIAAAIIFIVTWTIKLPVPATSGAYINLGDSMIYLSAYLLGGPIGAIAAAVGSALADTAAGAGVYIPATFVIKGLIGLIFGYMLKKKSFPMYAIACVLGGAVMTAGYALYETAVFGFAYAVVSLPFNLIQWAGSIIVAIVLYPMAARIYKAAHFNAL
jgi:uncharacterized membrane protein